MNDLISREEAIKAAMEGADNWDGGVSPSRDVCIAEEIEIIPSAQQWIPFSERKPDTGSHILITVLWEKGVDTAFDDDYEVMEEDWGVGEYEIKEGTATPLVKRIHERAIAWMPIPDPYRGEK